MFKLSPKFKNYILNMAPFVIIFISFGFILNEEQNKKQMLIDLLKRESESHILDKVIYFRSLKDINCSLKNSANKDTELLQSYLDIYEKSLSDSLVGNYVSDNTKNLLKSALEYIPCDCRTKT